LDNEQDAPEPQAIAAQPKPSWRTRVIENFKCYLQERRSQKKKQTPTDRAAISTARATWAIAILALVTVGVGISQYVIFNRQLNVMKGQLDVMLRDEEPHFVLTEKLAPPIFHPVVAGNDSLGVAAWNIPYINSGKSVARNITVNTYMSLDYAPFIRSNSLLRPEPIKIDEIVSGSGGFFTVTSQIITKAEFDVLRAKELAIANFCTSTHLGKVTQHPSASSFMPMTLSLMALQPNAKRT
jgi:hypothetical protein